MIIPLFYLVLRDFLPGPSKSVILVPKLVPFTAPFLKVPPGYRVNLFAEGLKAVRMIAVAPNDDVFVVQTRIEVKDPHLPHQVTVLWDADKDGVAEGRQLWSDKLFMPFGIQFGYGHLYVANTGSIVRWPYKEGQRVASSEPEVVLDGIPQNGYRNHWTRNILFDFASNKLYLTIGSEQNVAVEGERRAVVESYDLDSNGLISGKRNLYASGMRNPIGLAFQPTTHELFANVVERDYLGDGLPPDYVTSIRQGNYFGWPYRYMGTHVDPRIKVKGPDTPVKVPDFPLQAHSTPIDIKFVTSAQFPELVGDALVTLHGSQNRSRLNGYEVIRLKFDAKGRPTGRFEPFITGWLPRGSNKEIYGRPDGMAFLHDGSLLVADDWGGRIWRVSREK
ncbi:MAG: PQQ-dependent sugar dehydrogenase [Armatimonadota bacterium]